MGSGKSWRSFVRSLIFLFLLANIYPGILFLLDWQHWYWSFRMPVFWIDVAAVVGCVAYLARDAAMSKMADDTTKHPVVRCSDLGERRHRNNSEEKS